LFFALGQSDAESPGKDLSKIEDSRRQSKTMVMAVIDETISLTTEPTQKLAQQFQSQLNKTPVMIHFIICTWPYKLQDIWPTSIFRRLLCVLQLLFLTSLFAS